MYINFGSKSKNDIDREINFIMGKYAKNPPLSVTFIKPSDLAYLLSVTERLPSLTDIKTISFIDFKCDRKNCENLTFFLTKTREIVKLDLGQFKTGLEEVRFLEPIFEITKNDLMHFSLSLQILPSQKLILEELFSYLKITRNLHSLNLKIQNNSIDDISLKGLNKAINSNINLKIIFLKFKKISQNQLMILFRHLSSQIKNLSIHVYEVDINQNKKPWEIFEDFSHLNLKELSISANLVSNKLLLYQKNLQSLTYMSINSVENFLTLIDAIKSNKSLKSLTISPIITSNNELLKKFVQALELTKIRCYKFEYEFEFDHKYIWIDDKNKVIKLSHDDLKKDSEERNTRWQLFVNYYKAIINSLKHNFSLDESRIICYTDFKSDEIRELNQELDQIKRRNKSLGEMQSQKDLVDFRHDLIEELSGKISDEEKIQRAIQIANAVTDYYISPFPKDKVSNRLNEIFTQIFEIQSANNLQITFDPIDIFFKINKAIFESNHSEKSNLFSLSLNQVFSKILSDESEDRITLQSIDPSNREMQIIANHLLDYCKKTKENFLDTSFEFASRDVTDHSTDYIQDDSFLDTSLEYGDFKIDTIHEDIEESKDQGDESGGEIDYDFKMDLQSQDLQNTSDKKAEPSQIRPSVLSSQIPTNSPNQRGGELLRKIKECCVIS